MVVGSNENKNVDTENKGVNITSDTFPIPDNTSEALNNSDFPSLCNVRNQLQNVIDVMGTTTPHLVYSSSGAGADADNEESVISSTSIFSSVLQVKHINKNRDQCQSISSCNSPREISEMSNVQESETYAMINELPHEKLSQQPLCMPAVLPPAILCMNPSCVCTHSFGYPQQIPIASNQDDNRQVHKSKDKLEKKHKLSALIGKLTKVNKEQEPSAAMELYKMNIMKAKDNESPPQRFVFDLVEEVPKPEVNTVGTNTKNCNKTTSNNKNVCLTEQTRNVATKKHTYNGITTQNSHYSGMVVAHNISDANFKNQHAAYYKNLEEKSKLQYTSEKDTARVDVYYFDHGNAAYYRTTDSPPLILTEILAEKAESYATKFWAELFGTIYIGFAFLTSFILQFFRFLLHSIIRPLTIGLLQLVSDYFFKPFLAALFNAVIQPPLIFLYNIATSLRDLCDPLAEGLGYFLREIAVICKSIRLFEIKKDKHIAVERSCKTPG